MLSQNLRCAIYTRKSSERGLDRNVTSLDAQRDVCHSYIKCQAHRNWIELPQNYDDGGYSGGTLERPALKRLFSDIEAGRIDVIVIYKIDRLTRSLLDFVRLIDVLERHQVSFVRVTQAFDTSDSMGRLVLNILLTFAQFERELASDRVRDKKAAMQRKGYFTGGNPPFGYLVDSGGRLCIDDELAPIVRELYARYPEAASVRVLVDDLRARGCATRRYVSKTGKLKGGQPIRTAYVRHILQNPIYTGHIVHRGEWIEAEVDPLVSREAWDIVQAERLKRMPKRDPVTDFLSGILFDEHGRHMRILRLGPGRTNRLRYYRSEAAGWSRRTEHKRVLVNADQVEKMVRHGISAFLRDRKAVKEVVMADLAYCQETAKLLGKGFVAARRVENMAAPEFRSLVMAVTPRIEVTTAQLSLCLCCAEVKRLLAWDGNGCFSAEANVSTRERRIHVVSYPACLIRGHHRREPPVKPRGPSTGEPLPCLLRLVSEADELKRAVFSNRDKSLLELAGERQMSQNQAVRLLRVNYLAPDILASIIDGVQPAGVTQYSLLEAAMTLDWKHQRELLGYGSS